MPSTDGKLLANLVNCTTDGTAAAPPISFGGGFNNNSGTGVFGDVSSMGIAVGGTSRAALTSSLCTLAVPLSLSNDVVLLTNAGVPTNAVTGAAVAGPGSICIDYTNANLYVNANTKASPTWKLVTRAA